MEFQIGDRVICIKAYEDNHEAVGKLGTVVVVRDRTVGVEFDEPIWGNNLNGMAKDDRCGWYFSKSGGHIELYNIDFNKDEFCKLI